MKMKKGLMSVAALLSASSILAAMSFSSAEVKSDMNVSLTDSANALLALTPGNHAAAGLASNGELEINLNKGFDNQEYGVQNGSIYEWDNLFSVKNNSEKAVTVDLDVDFEGLDLNEKMVPQANVSSLAANSGNDDKTLTIKDGVAPKAISFTLEPGQEEWINIEVDQDTVITYQTDYEYEIIVDATADEETK